MLYGPGTGEDREEAGPEDVEYGSRGRDLRPEAEGGCVLRHCMLGLMVE